MKGSAEKVVGLVLALLLLGMLTAKVSSRLSDSPDLHSTQQDQLVHIHQPRLAHNFGKLPLSFEVNRGQADSQVKFLARGSGYALFLTGNEAVLSLRKPSAAGRQLSVNLRLPFASSLPWPATKKLPRTMDTLIPPLLQNPKSQVQVPPAFSNQMPAPTTVCLKLVDANPKAKVVGLNELPGRSNYFIGNDPKKWRTNIPTYATVRYQDLYPGVDLIYYGNPRQLEYDFVVAPGADPSRVRLRFRGAGKLRIDDKGDMVVGANGAEVRFEKPQVYQNVSRTRKAVEGRYWMAAANTIGFRVGDYDRSKPLVIDPVLAYSTYLGGEEEDVGTGIAVDNAGNAYVTGYTEGDFPTLNPLQPYQSADDTAFVTKINSSGSALVYSTYLGGDFGNPGYGIAVDSAGNAYVTGSTTSSNFPTLNPLQPHLEGEANAFVAKLNPTGSALVYSTYLGGSVDDVGMGIAVDNAGNAHVTGGTESTNFPTKNPLQPTYGGGYNNAFVAKINPSGSALVYSTYLGGSVDEAGFGIAVDSSGDTYVTGLAGSPDFPTKNPLQPALGGGYDAFVAKINPSGSALRYSTYLGGSGTDVGYGIAVDSSANAYVVGATASTNFPTRNPLQPVYGGGGDAFVAKINPSGSALVYSTYLGGSANDLGLGIAVDNSGNANVTGYTNSTNFPTTAGAFQTSPAGPEATNAFLTALAPSGSALGYSTYLGGSASDFGYGIALDTLGNAYLTGWAFSSNFPTTAAAFQTTFGGASDVFVAKFENKPQAQVANLADAVKAFMSTGTLNPGLGQYLLAPLNAALAALGGGSAIAAIRDLQEFIAQVRLLVVFRVLTATEGQTLINAANSVITALGS